MLTTVFSMLWKMRDTLLMCQSHQWCSVKILPTPAYALWTCYEKLLMLDILTKSLVFWRISRWNNFWKILGQIQENQSRPRSFWPDCGSAWLQPFDTLLFTWWWRTHLQERIDTGAKYVLSSGMGTSKKPVTRPDQLINRKRKRRDDKWGTDAESLSMGVNLLGNSLANRFLFTGISVSHYKAMLSRLDTLLELWAKELRHLFEVGFEHGGRTWRVAILGITGDAPFLKEVGYHTRSFHNVRKSSNANTPLPGCCWLCLAGKTGGAPFEDTSIVSAQWLTTCGVDNDPPWTAPSPLLMHIDQRRPSEFFRPDIFHIYHAGVGKDFSASAIIFFIRSIFRARNVDDSLAMINEQLRVYLQSSKDRIHFSKLTFDLLGYESSKTFPVGHWSKNLDTATMMKFVDHVAKEHVPIYDDEILRCVAEASEAVGTFMRILLSSDFFFGATTSFWSDQVQSFFPGEICHSGPVVSTRQTLSFCSQTEAAHACPFGVAHAWAVSDRQVCSHQLRERINVHGRRFYWQSCPTFTAGVAKIARFEVDLPVFDRNWEGYGCREMKGKRARGQGLVIC